jgi:HAE1 family hydrophobic/amphiphilic exporter-1
MGGSFVNYFTRFGRQWQVYVQAEGDARVRAEQLDSSTCGTAGQPVPLSHSQAYRTGPVRSSPCGITSTVPPRST